MTGPPKPLKVGETAQFTIDVTNTGSVTLQNVRIVDRCDPALFPTQATDGCVRADDGSLVWNPDTLLAGQAARRVIRCTCQAASAKAFNRVAVTTPDGGHAEGEASLEILKPEKPAFRLPRQLLRQRHESARG